MGASAVFDVQTVRRDFPQLGSGFYLDNAATTMKPACVLNAMTDFYQNDYANVHRGGSPLGLRATERFEQARVAAKRFLGNDKGAEVVFTAGTTQGLNLLAYGCAQTFLRTGDNVVVTALEHHANFLPWQRACRCKGALLRMAPLLPDGTLDMSAINALIDNRTAVVAITAASNLLGYAPPIAEIVQTAHRAGAVVVVDGAQAAAHLAVTPAALGCDFYCFSGHKIYGPTGIGVLWGKRRVMERLPPFLLGGGMVDRVGFEGAQTRWRPLPARLEAGTPPMAEAVGLQAAIAYLDSLDFARVTAYEAQLTAYAWRQLQQVEGFTPLLKRQPDIPVLSFNLKGLSPYDVGALLGALNTTLRCGEHCAQPALRALGQTGAVRVSLAMYNTFEEVDVLCSQLERIAARRSRS